MTRSLFRLAGIIAALALATTVNTSDARACSLAFDYPIYPSSLDNTDIPRDTYVWFAGSGDAEVMSFTGPDGVAIGAEVVFESGEISAYRPLTELEPFTTYAFAMEGFWELEFTTGDDLVTTGGEAGALTPPQLLDVRDGLRVGLGGGDCGTYRWMDLEYALSDDRAALVAAFDSLDPVTTEITEARAVSTLSDEGILGFADLTGPSIERGAHELYLVAYDARGNASVASNRVDEQVGCAVSTPGAGERSPAPFLAVLLVLFVAGRRRKA